MKYKIEYYCTSHVGKIRDMNQDNFVCGNAYMNINTTLPEFPLVGCMDSGHPTLVGVFDGMGGEEHGEIASLIAAKTASTVAIGMNPIEDLLKFCRIANNRICKFSVQNNIFSMGTTAALLAFGKKEITLCNIGDSKIFRFTDNNMEQISVDHYSAAPYGTKPPLSQNLGIPDSEFVIEPYAESVQYNDGDVYLLCSDGLTDMVPLENIKQIIDKSGLDESIYELLNTALENGGKDNVTIILCKVEREQTSVLRRIFKH